MFTAEALLFIFLSISSASSKKTITPRRHELTCSQMFEDTCAINKIDKCCTARQGHSQEREFEDIIDSRIHGKGSHKQNVRHIL